MSVSCARTSILSASSAKTYEASRHADTSATPPCANAQGREKPPAPKMALTVFTTAAVSPVSAGAGVDAEAARATTEARRDDASSTRAAAEGTTHPGTRFGNA